jgi:hypothetical protein
MGASPPNVSLLLIVIWRHLRWLRSTVALLGGWWLFSTLMILFSWRQRLVNFNVALILCRLGR